MVMQGQGGPDTYMGKTVEKEEKLPWRCFKH